MQSAALHLPALAVFNLNCPWLLLIWRWTNQQLKVTFVEASVSVGEASAAPALPQYRSFAQIHTSPPKLPVTWAWRWTRRLCLCVISPSRCLNITFMCCRCREAYFLSQKIVCSTQTAIDKFVSFMTQPTFAVEQSDASFSYFFDTPQTKPASCLSVISVYLLHAKLSRFFVYFVTLLVCLFQLFFSSLLNIQQHTQQSSTLLTDWKRFAAELYIFKSAAYMWTKCSISNKEFKVCRKF